MMKWRPWPPLHSKKFKVNLVLHSLEGLLAFVDSGNLESSKFVVNVKWKGPKGKLGSRFRRNIKRDSSTEQCIAENGVVDWNEEFEHVCVFTMGKDGVLFHPWDVCFEVIHMTVDLFLLHGHCTHLDCMLNCAVCKGEVIGVDLTQESRNKSSIIGASFLNLAEFASPVEEAKQSTKIPVSCCIGGMTAEAVFSITLSFVELQTSSETLDPVNRAIIPSLSFSGVHLSSDKEEFSAFRAGLRKVKILREYVVVGRAKKASGEEDGSDCKLSPRSEEHESAELFDSDSVDESDEDEAEDRDGSRFRKSFSYGSLATANLVIEGALYLQSRDVDGDNWVMNGLEAIPKLIEEPTSSDSDYTLPQPSMRSLLSWKRRKVSFRSPRTKGEPLLNKAYGEEGGDDIDFDRRQSSLPIEPLPIVENKSEVGITPNVSGCLDFGDDNFTIGSWEQKEFVSRDGQMNLSAKVFFASIDQRSERAAGESACTALVAVIAAWLQKNPNSMPIKSQFDTLIREGSLEWRKLCEVEAYKERFSDRHFDLETVLQAKVRPLSVIPSKSFIGFFQPEGLRESCEFLQEAMSFDSIWEEITNVNISENQDSEPQIYIVSWNDHFFVLKVEKEACYIIDTLGERLFEGCNQAYILKFDENTEMYQLPPQEQNSEEEKSNTFLQSDTMENVKPAIRESANQIRQENAGAQVKGMRARGIQRNKNKEERLICRGKECCKEFIKGFLAALPLRELQIDIKKGLMGKIPLHRRLQIEFHFTGGPCAPPSMDLSML
eukprot:Gb_13177 [translate_table: standard]